MTCSEEGAASPRRLHVLAWSALAPPRCRHGGTAWMQVQRAPVQPGPAHGYSWIPWAVLLAMVATIACVMNGALAASGTNSTSLEISGSAACRQAWPSHVDVALGDECSSGKAGLYFSTDGTGATDLACSQAARPDALRETDGVELRWLLSACSYRPPD